MLKTPSVPYTNQQVLDKISGILADVFPSKTWFVAVYNGEDSSHFSAHTCLPQMCISAVNLLGRYNVFAVGIDTINVQPNTKLLVSQSWKNYLNTLPNNDAYTQVFYLR
jgi:kynurenine formamidase